MNYLQRKRLALMQNRKFKGYLKTVSGVPLVLTDCMGGKLVSLSVTGSNVGDKTKNLFDITAYTKLINYYDGLDITILNRFSINGNVLYMARDYHNGSAYLTPVSQYELSAGTYVLSGRFKSPIAESIFVGMMWSDDTRNALRITQLSNINDWNYWEYSFTITDTKTVKGIFLQPHAAQTITDSWFTDIQLEQGATATDYEPYGYKIPIVSNENITNIYLAEPLTGVLEITEDIPIFEGTTVITADTSVQPSDMSAEYYSKKP